MSKNTTKPKKNSYKQDMKTAYNVGYSKGWEDAYEIPKRFFPCFYCKICSA